MALLVLIALAIAYSLVRRLGLNQVRGSAKNAAFARNAANGRSKECSSTAAASFAAAAAPAVSGGVPAALVMLHAT